MKTTHTLIAIAGAALTLAGVHNASADVINIAFHNGGATAGGMLTRPDGTIVQTSTDTWNNPANSGGVGLSFSGFDLFDATGADSGADLAASAGVSTFNSNNWGSNSQDYVMMEGWYGIRNTESVSVSGLSGVYTSGSYRVVVYGDSDSTSRTMNYTIGSSTKTLNDAGTFAGTFDASNTTTFYGVTGSSFTLTGNPGGSDPRSAVNGLQIIADPGGKALIDINDNQGIPGSPDLNGNHWNAVTAFSTPVEINNKNGDGTPWTVNIDNAGGSDSNFTGNALGASVAPGDFDRSFGYNDGIFNNQPGGGVFTITYDNLNPNMNYRLEFWGDRGSNWIDGDLELITGTSGAGTDFLLEKATLLSILVKPNADGQIALTLDEIANTQATGLNVVLNVMSIEEVPAPAALPAGLAMLLLAATRRRRQR